MTTKHPSLAADLVQPESWYMARISHGPMKTPVYPEVEAKGGGLRAGVR